MIKLLNSALILFVVFMGMKQGWAMVTGKAQMLAMFGKWNFDETDLMLYGTITLLSAVLILYPKTFFWGNLLMASSILFILCLFLQDKNLKGVAIELPFFFMNLVIIYLQHPLVKID